MADDCPDCNVPMGSTAAYEPSVPGCDVDGGSESG